MPSLTLTFTPPVLRTWAPRFSVCSSNAYCLTGLGVSALCAALARNASAHSAEKNRPTLMLLMAIGSCYFSEALGEEDVRMTDRMILDTSHLPVSIAGIEVRRLKTVRGQQHEAAALPAC